MSLREIASYASDICAILAFLTLIVKPLRNKILGIQAYQEGLQCLLRTVIVTIYYKNLNKKALHEYEFKLVVSCYSAYVANHGNSFVKKVVDEMKEWEIVK